MREQHRAIGPALRPLPRVLGHQLLGHACTEAEQYVAAVTDRLLFVTQVAPYRDGPAGVHGVLDQAAVGVAQVAELHGLAPRRVDDVRTLERPRSATPARSRCSRSARRRGAPSRRPRSSTAYARAISRCCRSTPRPTRATRGTTTARSSVPASTVIRGRRRSPPTCSTRRIRRARTSAPSGSGTTRCTSSATCVPTRSVLLRVRDGELDLTAPGARPPSFGYPLAWCFTEGAGRVFSTSLGHFPARGRRPRTCSISRVASGGRWARAAMSVRQRPARRARARAARAVPAARSARRGRRARRPGAHVGPAPARPRRRARATRACSALDLTRRAGRGSRALVRAERAVGAARRAR